MKKNESPKNRKTPGPKPEVFKIEGDWGNAVKKSLEVKKRTEGWPK
jgi:hypothetical protein